MTPDAAGGLSHGELVELVVRLSSENDSLRAQIAELRAEMAKNSGNSSKPPSRDPAAERQRQAEARRAKRSGGKQRKAGKQAGAPGKTLEMSADPDETVVCEPGCCGQCGADISGGEVTGWARRQVVEVPEVKATITEYQAVTRRCGGCGAHTAGAFPEAARSSTICYGPRLRAVVVYLLARQHVPVGRAQEAMRDLFGVDISAGAVDSFYAEAGRRLAGFLAALVVLLRALPVLHADETSDRVGTVNCWMHVVCNGTYTLIHASATRGMEAIRQAGVLIGYRGVVVHDRLAMYWKLKSARHGICGAHLVRDLASVAAAATHKKWAEGLAGLLVEINRACDTARAAGLKALSPNARRQFTARYDALVAQALAANPDPQQGRKRKPLDRQSYNLAVAFQTHKQPILAYMNNLALGMTNNQAERDLRPVKLHRKISSCFKSQAGAERFAAVRSYLSTTRKNNVPAIDALTRLFNGNPWMPPQPQAR